MAGKTRAKATDTAAAQPQLPPPIPSSSSTPHPTTQPLADPTTTTTMNMNTAHSLALARRDNSGSALTVAHVDKHPKNTARNIPAFLTKLFTMANDPNTNSLIRWSDTGESFIVVSAEKFGRELLPRYFKHSNFGSFVRQLNMYGFNKVPHMHQGSLKSDVPETEMLEFASPHFIRDQPDLLHLIQRKKAADPSTTSSSTSHHPNSSSSNSNSLPNGAAGIDLPKLMSEFHAIRKHQTAISADLKDLQTSNGHLWQEAIASRDRHKRSQETINKILGFLAQVFGARVLEEAEGTGGSGGVTQDTQGLRAEGAEGGVIFEGPEMGPMEEVVVGEPKRRVPPRLLLEDVKRDGEAQEKRKNAGEKGPPTGNHMQLDTPSESRFFEHQSNPSPSIVDDSDPRFTSIGDSPPSDTPPDPNLSAPPFQNATPTSLTGLPPDLDNPMFANLLSQAYAAGQASRTPQPYALTWPADTAAPAPVPVPVPGGASSTGTSAPMSTHNFGASITPLANTTMPNLPPPIISPTRFNDPTPSSSSSLLHPLPSLSPHHQNHSQTAAIGEQVDSLQAMLDQLVGSLPPEAQAHLGSGSSGAGLGLGLGAQGEWGNDMFNPNEYFGNMMDNSATMDTQLVQPPTTSASAPAPSSALSPLSSFLATYTPTDPHHHHHQPPPVAFGSPSTGVLAPTQEMDEFDELWNDSVDGGDRTPGVVEHLVEPVVEVGVGKKRDAEGLGVGPQGGEMGRGRG